MWCIEHSITCVIFDCLERVSAKKKSQASALPTFAQVFTHTCTVDFDMSYSSVQNDVSLYMSQPSICDNSSRV